MRVAIIGSGIAGLGAAWQLRDIAGVTIFEKAARVGGHSHTVDVPDGTGGIIPVDTGFIVYNRATYPNLMALFAALGVETSPSDMSFAASLDDGRTEYAGDSLATLIGHWRNLARPRHWQMLVDLIRFLRQGEALCASPTTMTLGEFLDDNDYSGAFRDDHLLPMAGAIWSMPPERVLDFPARGFGEFFRNHGLLEADIARRPEWRTVKGGSRRYVARLLQASGAVVRTEADIARIEGGAANATIHFGDGSFAAFDHVVLATHADEALALVPELQDVLGAFHYSSNETYLHRDEMLMPRRKRLWASWNYIRQHGQDGTALFVTYWMNRLQGIDKRMPLFVTLNPPCPPREGTVSLRQTYHHPIFDKGALAAQALLRTVQGRDRIWLCGSYFGFGFHEDALASGLAVAEALGARREWTVTDVSPAFANATPDDG